jgi:Spy/CpxP family protein refolding chaperone
MGKISKSKWLVRLATLAIFALGFIAGVLTSNLYHWRHTSFPGRLGGNSFFILNNMKEQLALSPQQEKDVEKIFDDARKQLRELRRQSEPNIGEIRRRAEERLQQVLTSEQWQQFEQMKKEMHQHRGWYRGPR